MFDLHAALHSLVAADGSDLHLKVPSMPLARIHGELQPLPGHDPLTPADTAAALEQMVSQPDQLAQFEADSELDFAYAIPGLARFRVNAFRQRGSISIVARVIPYSVRTIDELGLPKVVTEIAEEERGLILLTGTTGSGKSSTLAAMVDHINRTRHRHIVTIEDPIEFLHSDRQSIINQREVGVDTASFGRAMRRVLRQDPDVILIGEMRDEETVRAALSAAETGHLVMSTVHTLDAAESITRILDFFPPHEQAHARSMLAGTLRGVVSQRLVKTPAGNGRVCVCEVLRVTGRARDMILDPDQTGNLADVIRDGAYYGMQTFDQALYAHLTAGRISFDDAVRVASSPHDFKLLVAAEGRRATSMDDLKAPVFPEPVVDLSAHAGVLSPPAKPVVAAAAVSSPPPGF